MIYAKRYSDHSRSGYSKPATKQVLQKDYILFLGGLSFLCALGFLSLRYINIKPDIAYAGTGTTSGFTESYGVGNGKRLINFSLKIAGLTESASGTLSGSNESGQPSISIDTSAWNQIANSGNENQNHKWLLLPNLATTINRRTSQTGSPRPIHKGGPEQQKVIDYAWEISHDKMFIYLLKAENGNISINGKSKIVASNGYRDFGLCQINKGFHPEIVGDKRFSTDYRWQLDQCYRLYKGGTTFYGLKHLKTSKAFRAKIESAFTWTI